MVVFNGHLIHRDNFNALNISYQVLVVPSVASAPSSKIVTFSGGLKKNARLKKFSGEEKGCVKVWLEDAKVCFEKFRIVPVMCVSEVITAFTGTAAAWIQKFCREN